MSFTHSYMVPTTDWQDWLAGSVAFAADTGRVVSLDKCEKARQEAYDYLHEWGMETDGGWLAYQSYMVRRSDMTEVEKVDRSEWYDRTSTGVGTRYELAGEPGNALTLVACDLGDGMTEVWFDTYGV